MQSDLLRILVELHPLSSAKNQKVLVHWDQEQEEQKRPQGKED